VIAYHPMLRSKRWCWPYFFNGINMIGIAAWRIHREVGGKMSQLEFFECSCRRAADVRSATGSSSTKGSIKASIVSVAQRWNWPFTLRTKEGQQRRLQAMRTLINVEKLLK